jgi:hypothetical protein
VQRPGFDPEVRQDVRRMHRWRNELAPHLRSLAGSIARHIPHHSTKRWGSRRIHREPNAVSRTLSGSNTFPKTAIPVLGTDG